MSLIQRISCSHETRQLLSKLLFSGRFQGQDRLCSKQRPQPVEWLSQGATLLAGDLHDSTAIEDVVRQDLQRSRNGKVSSNNRRFEALAIAVLLWAGCPPKAFSSTVFRRSFSSRPLNRQDTDRAPTGHSETKTSMASMAQGAFLSHALPESLGSIMASSSFGREETWPSSWRSGCRPQRISGFPRPRCEHGSRLAWPFAGQLSLLSPEGSTRSRRNIHIMAQCSRCIFIRDGKAPVLTWSSTTHCFRLRPWASGSHG